MADSLELGDSGTKKAVSDMYPKDQKNDTVFVPLVLLCVFTCLCTSCLTHAILLALYLFFVLSYNTTSMAFIILLHFYIQNKNL